MSNKQPLPAGFRSPVRAMFCGGFDHYEIVSYRGRLCVRVGWRKVEQTYPRLPYVVELIEYLGDDCQWTGERFEMPQGKFHAAAKPVAYAMAQTGKPLENFRSAEVAAKMDQSFDGYDPEAKPDPDYLPKPLPFRGRK